MNRTIATLATAMIASTAIAATPATTPSAAAQYDTAFLAGDTQLLWDHASPELRKVLESPAVLKSFRDSCLGPKPLAGDVHTTTAGGVTTLVRTATAAGKRLRISLTVEPATSQLVGLLVRPETPADQYEAAFLAGNTKLVWDHVSPDLKKLIGTPAKLAALRASTLGNRPTPGDVQSSTSNGVTTLARSATSATGQSFTLTLNVTDATGQIEGLLLRPAKSDPTKEAPTQFLDYTDKADLRLPFTQSWTVAWGGRTVKQNYHAAYVDQRFAYDLLIKKAGSTHTGAGKDLHDFYCYGQPILSPAAGTVLEAVDGLPDNPPGVMDPQHAMGNHLCLDLGNDEYLFLCHLQPNSLQVKKGDAIRSGQPLALCGNSGNTSEPHLHIHIQTTPTPFQGKGLPLQFQHYTANDQPTARGEPTRDQIIHPQ